MPVTPAHGRQRQENSRFEVSLGYTVRHSLVKTNKSGMVVHTFNPSAEDVKAGVSLGWLAASLAKWMTSRPVRHPVSKLSVDGAWRKMLHCLVLPTLWNNDLGGLSPSLSLPLGPFPCLYVTAPWANFVFTKKALDRHKSQIIFQIFLTIKLGFLNSKAKKSTFNTLKGKEGSFWGRGKSHLLA